MPVHSTLIARPGIASFPSEIIYMILEELYNDTKLPSLKWPEVEEVKRDVYACTLVCRAWKPIAKRFMFRHVRFTLSLAVLIEASVDNPPTNPAAASSSAKTKTLESVHAYLEANDAVRTSIRHLELEATCDQHTPVEDVRRIHATELLSLLHLLPKLKELQLINIPIELPPDGPLDVCSPLDLLTVVPGNHCSHRDIYRLLHCFDDVQGLNAFDVACKQPGNAADEPPLPPDELLKMRASIIIIDGTSMLLTELTTLFFARQDVAAAIRVLLLRDVDSYLMAQPAFEVFMQQVKTSVVDLRLHVWPETSTSETIDFTEFTALETLSLNFETRLYKSGKCRKELNAIARLIGRNSTQPTFKTLILTIKPRARPKSTEDNSQFTWPTDTIARALGKNLLDQTLVDFMPRAGTGIRQVKINCAIHPKDPVPHDVALAVLHCMFPALRERRRRRLECNVCIRDLNFD